MSQERRLLLDQHLYPPNIAETLAALQRGPESRQPSSSRYGLQVSSQLICILREVESLQIGCVSHAWKVPQEVTECILYCRMKPCGRPTAA